MGGLFEFNISLGIIHVFAAAYYVFHLRRLLLQRCLPLGFVPFEVGVAASTC